MPRALHRALALAATMSLTGLACALGIRFDPDKMMRASEVKRGMEGYGLSVFQGTEPTRFGVRILGVVPQAVLGQPYIIFRVTDGPLIERDAPVMGGMSGSPVFIDGKLVGAIAYTYLYEKEPCGGITGVEAMIEGTTGQRVTQAFTPQPVRLGEHEYTKVAFGPTDDPEALPLQPIASPVYFSKGTERGNAWQRSLLGLVGLDGAPGAGSHPPLPVELKPGSGLGVELASGDFLIYTFGTLTWRDGDEVIGFGHPFSNKGTLSLPLTSVYIHDFVANYRRTDKDGVIMDRQGTIDVDCPWAVGGVVGSEAQSVPAVYRVVDETNDRERTFSVRLAYDRAMTPSLCLSTAFSAMDALYHGLDKPGIVRIRYRLRGSEGSLLQRSDVYYHSGDPGSAVGGEMFSSMRLFTDNRFEPQDIAEVSAEIRLRAEQDVARIERVYTDEEAAVAGRKLTVHVLLKPVGEPLVERVVTFDLPWELPKAGVQLGVASGESADYLRRELGGFTPEFHSLDRVVSYLESLERNDQLLVMLALPRQGVAVEDTPLPGLPLAYRTRLVSANRTGVRAIRDYEIRAIDVPWVVQGQYTTALPTVTRSGERGKPTPPKQKESSVPVAGAKLAATVNAVAMGTVPELDWSGGRVSVLPLIRARADAEETAAEEESSARDKDKEEGAKKEDKEGALAADKGQVQAKLGKWLLTTYEELAKGEPRGLAAHAKGWLVRGLRWGEPIPVPDPMIWDVAVNEGTCYVAAGLEGKLYALRDGKVEEFFSAPEGLLVTSVAILADGSVACAVVPEAKVYVLAPDGGVRGRTALDEHYVWDLLARGQDLWVATGRPARVYRLTPQGEKQLVAVVPEEHVAALGAHADVLYAATVDRGGLYCLREGRADQLLAWPTEEPTSLAVLDDGTVAVGIVNKASIVALRPDGKLETWYEDDDSVLYALTSTGDAAIAGLGAPAAIIRARGPDDWELVARDLGTELFGAFALDGDKRLWAAACLPGEVFAQDPDPRELVYLTAAYDAKESAKWLQLLADPQPPGTKFHWESRTGPSPYYDAGLWAGWAAALPSELAYSLGSAPGRYVQLRVSLPSDADEVLRSAVVRYKPPNKAPTLKVTAPEAGSGLHEKTEITWEAKDPDEDTVQVDLAVQKQGDSTWQEVAKRCTGKSYEWQTKGLEDGVYRLRVSVTDLPSRPDDAATAHVYVGPVIVDNTAPKLQVGSGPVRGKDGTTEWELLANDAMSGVASVAWRYPEADLWYGVVPSDGVYGGRFETCRLVLPAEIKPGTEVTVRVRDAAGNHADLVVKVPEPPKEPE